MFTYLHSYMPNTWDAQIKAGFIDENSGIRFHENICLDEDMKFNNLAKIGGRLYQLLKDNPMPFYIDRLQGGSFFENYKYDKKLINEYIRILGDKFWGYQMHEWASNLMSDYGKFRKDTPHLADGKHWDKNEIEKTIRKHFPYKHLFLEAMSSQEFAECGDVKSYEEFYKIAVDLFKKRQKETDGYLLPCDSFLLAYPLEIKQGAKRFMPEIGAQTENTRMQIAFARGMAKMSKTHFGAYYEPWGGEPFSACNYHRQGLNEWNHSNDTFPFDTFGGSGGSSRSLQMRLHLYAYMAGAEFITEEWGMCNTFYDWEDFEITPYGAVKLNFLSFTRKYKNIGKIITPVAVVLPKWLDVLDDICRDRADIGDYALSPKRGKEYRSIKKVLREIFCDTAPMAGNETEYLLNYFLPDAIDVVTEDYINTEDYEYLINLTGNKNLAENKKIITPEELPEVFENAMPCKVSGGLHHMVTKTDNDKFYLMILNNSGVSRTVQHGEKLLSEADKTVSVTTKNNKNIKMLAGNSSIVKENNEYFISVPAGGWFFGEF